MSQPKEKTMAKKKASKNLVHAHFELEKLVADHRAMIARLIPEIKNKKLREEASKHLRDTR